MDLSEAQQKITDPTQDELGDAEEYEIHCGYRPFLLGLIREIEFMTEDKLSTHNCLFRAVYLIMVLDQFAEELNDAYMPVPERWRSRVLNPLLQRQLRGVSDHEPEAVKNEVGDTLEASAQFYLTLDPLDPTLSGRLRKNILYIWHVRMSFMFLGYDYTDGGDKVSMSNTELLLDNRAKYSDDEFKEGELYGFEWEVITAEKLERLYSGLVRLVRNLKSIYPVNLPNVLISARPGRRTSHAANAFGSANP